jgi:hypothetical protein
MYSQLIIKFKPTNANDVPNLQNTTYSETIYVPFFFLTKKIYFQEPTLIRVQVAIKLVTEESEANCAL